jgi:ketosteroid isomerase-like protein
MKVIASVFALLAACAVFGITQEARKPSGEEGRIIALESAWDQAEQNRDVNALSNLLGDNLVYVDYDGSLSNKEQFLASIKSGGITTEQINNEGVTVRLYNNDSIAVSTGIYRDRGVEKGKPFSRRGRFTDVWINQGGNWKCIASQSTLIAH